MDVAALIAWVVTAGGGFGLLGIWIAKGGLRQQETKESRFPAPVVFGHFLLAAVGLVVWIGYIVSDESSGLAWTAFALLIPVALLGFTMLVRWWQGRQPTVADVDAPVAAEQRFPLLLVAAHGIAAVTTVVLVLLAAAEVAS
jgi:hypothetical protein